MHLEFRDVYKSFGETKVLKSISFSAKSGIANGYLGRNGSGKTTTFRLLLDIFRPDRGEILLDGKPINRKEVKIGYLPEERGMYDGVGLVDQLVYFGMLKGMSKQAAKQEAVRWLQFFELEDSKKELKTLSKGNAQKIQIIQCVMDNPDILVLDEPFSGLDPVNVGKLKEIINDFIAKDKLVIFSSHQMPVVETFCEDINLLEKGEIILSGSLDDIKRDLGKGKMLLSVAEYNAQSLITKLEQENLAINYSVFDNSVLLDFAEPTAKAALLNYLAQANFNIEELKLFKPSLENIFVEKVGAKHE